MNRWTVERSLNNFQVRNGRLELPIDQGSMYQGGTTAKNVITQPAPTGVWTVTSKIQVAALDQNYQQAGLRVWTDDDNWASVHMISAGGNRQFEFIFEDNGNPRNGAADNTGPLPADSPLSYYVRLHSDGTNLTASYSFNGDTFLPVGQPAPLSAFPANLRVGPTALSDQAPAQPLAYFDWIRFDPDEGTGGGGGGGGSTVLDEFNGTDIAAPPWEVVRRDQATDRRRRRAAHPGPDRRHLRRSERRQEPRAARRAGRHLDGDDEGRLRGHHPATTRRG